MRKYYAGIDHVQLAAPVGSEDVARRFFGETLGMTEIPKPRSLHKRGGLWFQCGAQQLHIGIQEDFRPATKAHPAFRMKHIDEFRAGLLARGVALRDDDLIPGAKRFYLDDPFGNRIEFLEWT